MAEEGARTRTGDPVPFAPRLASDAFRSLFQEGMALVEETADYLDGEGRRDSRRLSRTGALAYASESMRLTTRLMQIASWLMLQRAVNHGEMAPDQALSEKGKIKLRGTPVTADGPGWEALPERLRSLILRSVRVEARVLHLDGAAAAPDAAAPNPVREQIGRITAAFAAGDGGP